MSKPDYVLVIGNKNWSSWSLRPWIAMRAAEIPFSEEHVALRRPDTRAQCLAHSPSGKVPVLKTAGQSIWDSLAIIEYLAETHPDAEIWPRDKSARAHARAICAEMHAGFVALRTHMPMDCLARNKSRKAEPLVERDIARVVAIWSEARARCGESGPYLFGAFGGADAMYAPVVSRFVTYDVPLADPARRYLEAVWSHPAMQEWLSDCEKEMT